MILCCAIFSYPSDSDIEGEFLVEFVTPECPHYVKNLLDRLSKLTAGIIMVNSSLVNVSFIVTIHLILIVYTQVAQASRPTERKTAINSF